MKEFRAWMDSLPKIVKIILALPGLDILWGIYRICKGTDNIPNLILGIVWIFAGTFITWVLDLIFLILDKPVFEL